MNRTLVKKIIGTASFVFAWVAMFATTEHVAAIQAILPHTPMTSIILGTLLLIGNIYGKHPWSSASVPDAIADGHLNVEVQKAEVANEQRV